MRKSNLIPSSKQSDTEDSTVKHLESFPRSTKAPHEGATIYCSGLSPLLYLCCSGIFKNSRIVYISFQNLNPLGKKRRLALTLDLAKKIANFFGHSIDFSGPYKISAAEFGAMHSTPLYEDVNINIKDGDFVTKNLQRPLTKVLSGKKVNLLPEGASCYIPLYEAMDPTLHDGRYGVDRTLRVLINRLSSSNTSLGRIVQRAVCKTKTFALKRRFRHFERLYLLPVRDQKGTIQLSDPEKYSIFSGDIFFENLRRVANEFAIWFPEADVRHLKSAFFHTGLMGVHADEYAEYSVQILEWVGECPILLKDHPSILESCGRFFSDFSLVAVPDELQEVPGELLFFQADFIYIGYVSTMLLFAPEDRRIVLEPSSNLFREVYGRKFDCILHLVGANRFIKRLRLANL